MVTWWSGPYNALTADAFEVNRFDVTDIVPVGYAIFAMALGICAGALLRRSVPGARPSPWPASPRCGWRPRCGSGCAT